MTNDVGNFRQRGWRSKVDLQRITGDGSVEDDLDPLGFNLVTGRLFSSPATDPLKGQSEGPYIRLTGLSQVIGRLGIKCQCIKSLAATNPSNKINVI
jgi:hypothetical protein